MLHLVARKQVGEFRQVCHEIVSSLKKLPDDLKDLEALPNESNPAQLQESAHQMIFQQFQYDTVGRLHTLAGLSEPFWINYALQPDTYFHTRRLPELGMIADLNRPKVVSPASVEKGEIQFKRVAVNETNQSKLPRSERVRARRSRYDVREFPAVSPSASIKATLLLQTAKVAHGEVHFYSGETDNRYKVAEVGSYYDLITADLAAAILAGFKHWHLYASMLAFYHILAGNQVSCHLAFSREVISVLFGDPNTPFREPKYLSALHLSQHYALTLLHREEAVANGWASESHRFVLDPEVMEMIPRLNYRITSHPWVPMSLSPEQLINPEHPLRYEDADSKYRGYHSLEVFQIRYAIFHEGTLDGLCMDKIHAVGSLIPSCLIRSPLELQFGIECDRTDLAYWQDHATQTRLRRYFNEYYPSKSILKGWQNVTIDDLIEIEDELTDIDLVVDADTDQEFNAITLRIYRTIEANLLKTNAELGPEDLQILQMPTKRGYKYYISGRLLGRSFEVFRMEGQTAIAGVSRFHFPCVRATYDGYQVKVLASNFVYAMTGILTGYRWFSVSDYCLAGVLKYYTRGGYLPMNPGEITELRKFLDGPGKTNWSQVLRFSKLGYNHPIYRPREFAMGLCSKFRSKELGGVLPSYIELNKHHEYVYYDATPTLIEMPEHLNFRYTHGNLIPWDYAKVSREVRELQYSKKYTPGEAEPAPSSGASTPSPPGEMAELAV